MGGQVVHDDDVAGLEFQHQHLLHVARKAVPFIGPSSTIGAVMPVSLKPATKVVVFQWRCGMPACNRSPFAARPRLGDQLDTFHAAANFEMPAQVSIYVVSTCVVCHRSITAQMRLF